MITQLTDQESSALIQEGKPVMVMFYANWCGSCRLFKPKFERISNRGCYDGIEFITLNAEECPQMRKKAQVNALPFFATFHQGELQSSGATIREEQICRMLESITGKAEI